MLGGRWQEIDFVKRAWIIPADRMKGEEKNTAYHFQNPLWRFLSVCMGSMASLYFLE